MSNPYKAPSLHSVNLREPPLTPKIKVSVTSEEMISQASTISSHVSADTNSSAPLTRRKPSFFKRIFCCAAPEPVYAPHQPEMVQRNTNKQVTNKKSQNRIKKWIYDASTPAEQIPFKTWAEWHAAYSQRLIDIDNPPEPSAEIVQQLTRETSTEDPSESAYARKNYSAPRPWDDDKRSLAMNRLDIHGKFGPPVKSGIRSAEQDPEAKHKGYISEEEAMMHLSEEDLSLTKDDEYVSPTLEGHPAFKKIVSYARQLFGTKISMITVLEDDVFTYLAESGLGARSGARDVNFCAHTLLSSPEKGLVALDLTKDWRFSNNTYTRDHNIRFYAGVPLMAPQLSADEEPQPIGTLCIVDDQPRSSFSEAERQQLLHLGEMARKEIAAWHKLRMAEKTRLMRKQLATLRAQAAAAKKPPALLPILPKRSPKSRAQKALPSTIPFGAAQQSPAVGRELSYWEVDESDEEEDEQTDEDWRRLSVDDDSSSGSRQITRTFNLATKMIAKTLALPLVYLIALNVDEAGSQVFSMDLMSSFGLPDPKPSFDKTLHLKALKSPEGGLLYQNPKIQDMQEERFPESSDITYASAILASVAQIGLRGYVLAAFARDPEKVFGLEDFEYLREIGEELAYFAHREATMRLAAAPGKLVL